MVSLQVVDKNAHAVRSYNGYAEVRVVSGQARLALLGGRTLPVRDGTARICVAQASAAPEPVSLRIALPGLSERGCTLDWGLAAEG
ncbi:MAG: hypothetical protein PHR35_22525, partial [Kiritimatiellae bacterium]|nr:hypothetical protein [Kiritimatiellia bacterium]